MATWDRQTHYYSGQGVVLIGEYDDSGHVTGLEAVGNVTSLKINIETSISEHKESQSGQRAVDMRLTTETKAGATMTLENFSRDILAMALRGGYTAVAAGSVTDQAMVAALGKVQPLGHVKVSAVTVSKGVTPLVAYTDDVTPYDYQLNAEAGSIMFATTPATAELVDGDDLTVDYTYASQARVDALTGNPAPRFLRFEGLNTADSDSPMVVEAFRFTVDPAKELELITGEDPTSFELEGTLLADATRTTGSKFFRQMLLR
ncbi:MAG: hypothetical protein EOM10_00180 [Opitutae bacterium]|nr:hypothetical protein [Opitutae bacterium]